MPSRHHFCAMEYICVRCGGGKPAEEFYTSDRTCKECRRAMVRANRLDKIEYYRDYDKGRNMRPDRVSARSEYIATEGGRAAKRRANGAYCFRHKNRRAAVVALNNAVRAGRVLKQPCFMCGCEIVEGHHADYDRPLDVVWLCVEHHKEIHLDWR